MKAHLINRWRLLKPLFFDSVDTFTTVVDCALRVDQSVQEDAAAVVDQGDLDKNVVLIMLIEFTVDRYEKWA